MSKRPKVSLLRFTFLSRCIGRQQDVNILLPYGCHSDAPAAKRPYKTLWLLHGKSDDYNTWLRNSVVETVARENDLAVVMPDAGNSFYTDMAMGPDYYTYITKEVPEVLRGLLPLSDKKEDNYLCGFSMGGYGAFKIGLTRPEEFAALGCFSSAADIAFIHDKTFPEAQGEQPLDFEQKLLVSIFGEETHQLPGSRHDLFRLLDECNERGAQPPIYMSCGTEDFLYPSNCKMRDYAAQKGYDVTWQQGPGGHDWNVWNRDLPAYIAFLKERGLLG